MLWHPHPSRKPLRVRQAAFPAVLRRFVLCQDHADELEGLRPIGGYASREQHIHAILFRGVLILCGFFLAPTAWFAGVNPEEAVHAFDFFISQGTLYIARSFHPFALRLSPKRSFTLPACGVLVLVVESAVGTGNHGAHSNTRCLVRAFCRVPC